MGHHYSYNLDDAPISLTDNDQKIYIMINFKKSIVSPSQLMLLAILSIFILGSYGCKKNDDDGFTASFTYEMVNDNTVKYINTSTGEYYSMIWEFGNGESDTTTNKNDEFTVYYPFAGEYEAKLTIQNYTGGKSSASSSFTITNDDLNITFTAEIDSENPNYVNLKNTTQGNYDSFMWLYLEEVVENENEYQAYFPFKGTYEIELKIFKGDNSYSEIQTVIIEQDDSGNIPGLIWSDEFDYIGLPTSSKWNMETGGNGWGNNELQYYTNREANAKVENGFLTITAQEEDYGGRSYTSARITTQNKFDFKYGKIEARIKLPYGKGIWPAFWMLGANFSSVGWPGCGEIDIMEMVGGENGDNTCHSTLHWLGTNGHADYGQSYTLPSGIFADDFHVFSVIWTSQSVRGLVDDIEYFVIDITAPDLSEFHDEFFIIMNVAVGGNWPGSPDPTTVFPQEMVVDYVRVYNLQ